MEELREKTSRLVDIPLENLFLVYSGRVMKKQCLAKDYGLVENCIVYAINGKKYLRKVNRKEYEEIKEKHRKKNDTLKVLEMRRAAR